MPRCGRRSSCARSTRCVGLSGWRLAATEFRPRPWSAGTQQHEGEGALMPLEVGLWRVDGEKPVRVTPKGVPLESQLETMIEADPTILGTPLLLVGRQVPTDYGKFIDLLAIDDEGALHVLELKRDRTPREVVAQVLDYGSWVRGLSHSQVLDLFATYKPGMALEQEWTPRSVGTSPRSSTLASA